MAVIGDRNREEMFIQATTQKQFWVMNPKSTYGCDFQNWM